MSFCLWFRAIIAVYFRSLRWHKLGFVLFMHSVLLSLPQPIKIDCFIQYWRRHKELLLSLSLQNYLAQPSNKQIISFEFKGQNNEPSYIVLPNLMWILFFSFKKWREPQSDATSIDNWRNFDRKRFSSRVHDRRYHEMQKF